METIFLLSNLLVLPFWFVMIFAPRWRWTKTIISSPLIVLPPALIYAALVVPQIGGLFGALANPQLNAIAALLGTPEGATIGWAHFLAFDLFVGRWVFLDGHERGLHPVLMAVILFFVLMLGPLGLLMYLAARYAKTTLQKSQ